MVKYTNYNHFTENDVVDIRGLSDEQVKKILKLNPKNECNLYWIREYESEYYRPKGNSGNGTHGIIELTQEQKYKIHPASDFLDLEWQPKWGEEIEVSDDGENWGKDLFVGMNPNIEGYKYVCSNDNWIHIRPLSVNPRITEIKAQIEAL